MNIVVNDNQLIASYGDTKYNKIDENTLNLENITFYINKDKLINNKNNVKELLLHEFTHAFEDYCLNKKGLSLYNVEKKN
ncbi:MAG: hypothetical protein J6D03_00145 [Clostridia bacterium]|nr:hypothetical protein [Clostridia bacterium]